MYISVVCLLHPGSIQQHLLYPHTWVRTVSAQLLGLLFAEHSPQELATASPARQTTLAPPAKKRKQKKIKGKKGPEEEPSTDLGQSEASYLMIDTHSKVSQIFFSLACIFIVCLLKVHLQVVYIYFQTFEHELTSGL